MGQKSIRSIQETATGADSQARIGAWDPVMYQRPAMSSWIIIAMSKWPSGKLTELWKITMFNGKSTINGHFPVCKLLVYQRVTHQKNNCRWPASFLCPGPRYTMSNTSASAMYMGIKLWKRLCPALFFLGGRAWPKHPHGPKENPI
jgi:hypothetical protein